MGLSEPSSGRRMHALKRRKLAHSTSPIFQDSPLSLPNAPPLGTKAVVCASCHRAFPGVKQSQLVQCARYVIAVFLCPFQESPTRIDPRRCQAPTCTICSRTCNGCPPSVPPTPELSMSPATVSPASPAACSPDISASLSISVSVSFGNMEGSLGMGGERRPALAPHTNVTGTGTVGRRRKQREHDDTDDESRKGSWEVEDQRMRDTGILPGCGRVVCRGCSFETPERYVFRFSLLVFVCPSSGGLTLLSLSCLAISIRATTAWGVRRRPSKPELEHCPVLAVVRLPFLSDYRYRLCCTLMFPHTTSLRLLCTFKAQIHRTHPDSNTYITAPSPRRTYACTRLHLLPQNLSHRYPYSCNPCVRSISYIVPSSSYTDQITL